MTLGRPGTWGPIEAQLFLSVKTAVIMGITAAIPVAITAATGYLASCGGWVGMLGAALGAAGQAIYLRQSDNRGR